MRPLAGVALLVLLMLPAADGRQQGGARPPGFVPVAVWYGGGKARAPMLEPNPKTKRASWLADLEKIKSLGFNAIRCWIDWATAEPAEGKFDFDTLDVLLDLGQEMRLKVIIQVYADSAPEWVGKKYPDSHFVSISGSVMPSQAAPGFCSDHPGVRSAMLGFFVALGEHVANQSAFLGWDLWSEPHVINWASATYLVSPEFCFCPYTSARFREWLKKKYGVLDALNQAWYRRFVDWNDVDPPRLSTILSYTDYVDWRFFIIDRLAEDLRARYEAVKKVAPGRIATSHAAAPSLFTSPLGGDGDPDDWLMAKQVDFWGTSFYPKHSFPVGRDVAWRGALLDFSRSACFSSGDGFWVGELQGGFGTVGLRVSSTVTSDDIRVWTWSAIARGAKGINYYAWYPMSSGYESGGFGLINLDGSITERAKVGGQIGRMLDRNRELFFKAKPAPAEVAIVYDPLSYMVGGRRPLPAPGAQSEFAGIERNSMLGVYRALFPSNVPVDFIHVNEIAEGKAGRYKLIFFPYPLMVSQAAAKGLVDYVRDGGALVAEARLAWNDEHGWAKEVIPGFGLQEVCGCRETSVQQTASGKTEIQMVTWDQSVPLLQPGERLRGAVYEEVLEPVSERARVIGRFSNGSPAIVVSSYGRGKMITIGSFLGMLFESERDESLARFFSGLLDWAGVTRSVEVFGGPSEQSIEVRTMDAGLDELVFVFSHAGDVSEPAVRLRLPARSYAARNLLTEEPVSTGNESMLTLKKRLLPNEVWIVRIIPK